MTTSTTKQLYHRKELDFLGRCGKTHVGALRLNVFIGLVKMGYWMLSRFLQPQRTNPPSFSSPEPHLRKSTLGQLWLL